MANQYYVRDGKGKVVGPFSAHTLRQFAREGKIKPSWQVSGDRQKWTVAAKVQNLFDSVEKAIFADVSRGHQYRNLSRKEQIALFVDKFVLNNEKFKDSMPWLQSVRSWWARLTLPSRGFVIAEITPSGVRHVRYDFAREEASAVGQQEFEKRLSEGVRQSNWFTAFLITVTLAWAILTLKDFVGEFSLTVGTLKTALFVALVFLGFVYKAKRTKLFVGYVLAPEAEQKLKAISDAFNKVRRCSGVWAFEVKSHADEKLWKYNAGSLISVSKLPVALFNRPIPNVETNIKVCGVAYLRTAIYFLPEKLLVVDGSRVSHVPYGELEIAHSLLDYVEAEGHVFPDSLVIERKWKFINRDGSPDRRFKANVQLPVVRCGILRLDVADIPISLLTTNPEVPKLFNQSFPRLDSAARSTT